MEEFKEDVAVPIEGFGDALWHYVLSVYVGVAQNVFFWFKAMDKGKSGAYNTSYKRGKAIS